MCKSCLNVKTSSDADVDQKGLILVNDTIFSRDLSCLSVWLEFILFLDLGSDPVTMAVLSCYFNYRQVKKIKQILFPSIW